MPGESREEWSGACLHPRLGELALGPELWECLWALELEESGWVGPDILGAPGIDRGLLHGVRGRGCSQVLLPFLAATHTHRGDTPLPTKPMVTARPSGKKVGEAEARL